MLIKNSRLNSIKLFSTGSYYKDKEKDIITDVTEINKILNEWGLQLQKKYKQGSSIPSKSNKLNTKITQQQNYTHNTNTHSNSQSVSRHNLLERSKTIKTTNTFNKFNKLHIKT